jgi:hypothetical protein
VPAVRCALPKPDLTSKAGMLAYARVLVSCMDRAWAPLIARSDAYFQPPRVFAYSLAKLSATPECADPPANIDAFYLRDGTICLEWQEFLEADDAVWNLIDFQQLMAHEYGHHVQMSVGILTTYDVGTWARPEAVRLETERRKELQASCLAGAFLGANKRALRLTGERFGVWEEIVHHVGDEYNPDKVPRPRLPQEPRLLDHAGLRVRQPRFLQHLHGAGQTRQLSWSLKPSWELVKPRRS